MYLAAMSTTSAIVVLLATLHFLKVSPATIEKVRLVGDSNSYINIRSTTSHVLQCTFRAGYDDPVRTVNWYKDNRLAYSWNTDQSSSTAYGNLYGYVSTSGDKATLQNLNFNSRGVSLGMSGNYTCEVDSAQGKTRSEPFHLVILDVPSENYITNVTLLSDVLPDNETSSEVQANCTLLWNFQTPAIFPRPNVTCGYYSYLHDDVTNSIPAGLTMHRLRNGSWQASFDHTSVQIADIPRERRLGCSVSVPDTSYKKVVKFEDNFIIDHLIDSEGCPSFFLDPMYRLKFSLDGGVINCRGELEPISTGVPIKVTFRCAQGELAVFFNGTKVTEWTDEMVCNPSIMTWSRDQKNQKGVRGPSPSINITESLPMCVRYRNGGLSIQISPSAVLIGYLFLFLGSFVLLH